MQHTRESLRKEVAELAALGVPGVILFGVPVAKDAEGSGAWDPDGIVQLALADLRAEVGDDIVVMADLCLDEYTDHGHCGVLDRRRRGRQRRHRSRCYARTAVAQADAGAHVVAPSGMMDGQVAAIRAALDGAGHLDIADPRLRRQVRLGALRTVPRRRRRARSSVGGDRKGYQQDPANAREALAEVRLDLAEGADIVMVKPALAYLDVIAAVRAASSTCRSRRTTCRVSTRW